MIKRARGQSDGNGAKNAVGIAIIAVLAIGVCTAVIWGYSTLRRIWQEQCVVTDPGLDVVINAGKMVHPDIVISYFGLTNGANLATIPFAELRQKFLKRIHNLKDVHIERHMPNRVIVEMIERVPIARTAARRGHPTTGLVVDSEGMVFNFSRDIESLPLVREDSDVPTPPGHQLSERSRAALRLVETASLPEFSDLHLLMVETFHPDYFLLSLADSDKVKIAWKEMMRASPESSRSLAEQLANVRDAKTSALTPRGTVWIATELDSGRVYASSSSSRSGN